MSKRRSLVLFTSLAAALVLSALFATTEMLAAPPVHSKEIVLKFDRSALKTEKSNGRDFLILDRCFHPPDSVGAPQIPAYFARVIVPRTAKLEKVTVTDSRSEKLPGTYTPDFVRPPCRPGEKPSPSQPDANIYEGAASYPAQIVEFLREGVMRGQRILFFRVNPIQYLPKSKELLFYSQITVHVEYTIDSARAVAIKPCRKGEPFWRIIADSADNPADMEKINELEKGENPAPQGDVQPLPAGAGTVQYLIICSSAFQSEFQPLADWKKKKGVPAKIVTTQSISTDYSGVDMQEKIKRCIIDYVTNNGTLYVLLGGDIDTIPDRDTYGKVSTAPPTEDFAIPCDLYYAGLDDINWNDDGDNKCGEVSGDTIDMEPDVFVGRYACKTVAQVQAFVNKVINYEKNAAATGFSKELLLSGVMLWGWFDSQGNYYDSDYYSYQQGWVSDAEYWAGKTYDTCIAPYWSPNRTNYFDTTTGLSLTREALRDKINEGFGIFDMNTHGNVTVWGMESGSAYSTTYYASQQTNNHQFSIIYTGACMVNAFDDDFGGDPCLGESFTRNANGGAIAFIACSRYGWGSPGHPTGLYSDEYDKEFYKKLLGSGLYHLGEAYTAHKYTFAPWSNSYNPYRWLQFGINLLGDPELPVWTENPQVMSVTYPATIGTSSQTINIHAQPYSHICLWKTVGSTDEVYVYGDANASGDYSATINVPTPGTLRLTATKHNFYPFEADISAQGVSVTVETNIAGLTITGDGSDYTSPHTFYWAEGSSHTIGVASPQSGAAGIRYIFESWSDGGEQTHSIVVPSSPASYTATLETQYRLTTAPNDPAYGTVTPSGENWYDQNTVVTLTATPNAGGEFANWSGDLNGTENPKDLTMNGPKSVTADFILIPIASFVAVPTSGNAPLTVQFVDVSTGDITSWFWDFGAGATPPTANTQGPHSVTYSTEGLKTVGLTVTGPAGSDTQTWVDCINVLPPATEATLTIRSRYGSPDPPAGIWTYPINFQIAASVETPVYSGQGTRYICTGWRARGSPDTLPTAGTENTVTFILAMNTTITWTWKTQYLLTTTTIPEGSGTIGISPASPDGYYDAKSTVTLTAYESTGYDFVYWTGGLKGIANPQVIPLRGPRNVVANFALEIKYLTVNSSYGEPGPPVGTHEYCYGDPVTANCGPTPYSSGTGIQYVCTGHLGTGNLSNGSETSVSSVITDDSSVTWLWQTQYKLTTAANPQDWGAVTPSGETWHNEGAVVTLTATWNSPYGLLNWSGDLTGSENPKEITMDSSKSVTANFVQMIIAEFGGTPRSSAGWTETGADFPLTVNFTDESTGTITSWQWDFNNDETVDSADQNPSYTYNSPGRFTVKLTVAGPDGSDSRTKADYVRVIDSASRIYVRTGGLDTNDGLTWATAKKTIQAGINAAGNDYAVLVAKGTYRATNNTNLDFAGKAIHLKGVSAGGAYDSGTTWTIDCENVSGRRAFIFQTGETAHTVVENFTLYRGNVGADDGGGVYAYSASPTIMNCTVMSCRGSKGGGIYCEFNSNLTITGCTIKANQASDGDGGGIYCLNSSPRITSCTIGTAESANTATNNGGGIYCKNSNATIADCTIEGNSATWWGGAVCCENSSPKMSNCLILGNVASDVGGGIYLATGSDAKITDCIICGNSAAYYGGGIYCEYSTPTITNCKIGVDGAGAPTPDTAGDLGGGICLYSSSPCVTNCVIINNSAENAGGGIECWNNSSPPITNCLIANNCTTATGDGDGAGGGIDCYGNSNPTITNCTITDNTATNNGGGIYSTVSAPVLNNTILWGNTATSLGHQIYTWNTASAVTLNYSDYANNTIDPNNIKGSGTVTASNCIVSDPVFMDAVSYDYHLQATSPCIDGGNNSLVPAGATTDLDGNPRIAGAAVDMGAYERLP
jgi:predicted outer membrane repeat protein